MSHFNLTKSMLADLPKNGPSDPIEYYRRPWVGKLYLERINRGLRMLDGSPIDRALEVGYGAGAVLVALAEHVRDLHGIDLDADPQILSNYFANHRKAPKLVQGSVYELPYPQDSFDLVVSFSVFEHLQDYRRALGEVHRVLRAGGRFLLGMPAVNKFMEAAFLAIGYKGINDAHITQPEVVAQAFDSAQLHVLRSDVFVYPWPSPLGVKLYYNWLLQKA